MRLGRHYNPDTDRQKRQTLLQHYRRTRPRPWRRLRFYSKRLAWLAVVRATYFCKGLADIAVSAALLILLSPPLLAIALLIRLESPGPILIRQTRLGRWGRFITLWTFRTTAADPATGTVQMATRSLLAGRLDFMLNPRLTRGGRWLRRTGLDRLPQLWNVLSGDLSLLGPRPLRVTEANPDSLADRRRLAVIPGLIPLGRSPARLPDARPEPARLDSQYLASQSWRTDIQLLLQTIPAVFLGRDAYD